MIIKTIYIKEGLYERTIVFSEKNNLIHSEENSKGKTTLLRLLLYSIGYNIPNTKHIKFEECEVQTHIITDNGESIQLIRKAREYVTLQRGNIEETYILPGQERNLHKFIYGSDNIDLLNNILGAFYFDQEKGWTLLNRGIVIGSIRYNIEELIRGIDNIDCTELVQLREQKRQDLQKYTQMFSVSKYQEAIDVEAGVLANESYNDTIDSDINQCKIQQNIITKELQRIDKVLKDNQNMKKFIEDIGLLIRLSNGDTLPVTVDNIVGLNDTIDYLLAKKKIIASRYNQISLEIKELEKNRKKEEVQLSFFDDKESIADIFDKKIASIPINSKAVMKQITKIEKDIKDINTQIKELTRTATETITSIFNNAQKYLSEFGLDGPTMTEKYLFTSNLKELSGAILHKTVFSFRLACLMEIEKHLNIKLPIILDSPSGKEIDRQNISKMVNILDRDCSGNQIIISSIFEYDLKNLNKIEIKERLIDEQITE
ncbi:MAG: hypothetical protein J6T37_06875 [Bacteroidales bacterium]|nr:hypothetical protein [Bacteroidales bacterium]